MSSARFKKTQKKSSYYVQWKCFPFLFFSSFLLFLGGGKNLRLLFSVSYYD